MRTHSSPGSGGSGISRNCSADVRAHTAARLTVPNAFVTRKRGMVGLKTRARITTPNCVFQVFHVYQVYRPRHRTREPSLAGQFRGNVLQSGKSVDLEDLADLGDLGDAVQDIGTCRLKPRSRRSKMSPRLGPVIVRPWFFKP